MVRTTPKPSSEPDKDCNFVPSLRYLDALMRLCLQPIGPPTPRLTMSLDVRHFVLFHFLPTQSLFQSVLCDVLAA